MVQVILESLPAIGAHRMRHRLQAAETRQPSPGGADYPQLAVGHGTTTLWLTCTCGDRGASQDTLLDLQAELAQSRRFPKVLHHWYPGFWVCIRWKVDLHPCWLTYLEEHPLHDGLVDVQVTTTGHSRPWLSRETTRGFGLQLLSWYFVLYSCL